jgi:hypothetical protein
MGDEKRAAGAQHKILNLAWLPHFRESEPKRPYSKLVKPVELAQADVSAGFLTPDGVKRDSKLQGLVDDVLLKENPELNKFNFSLVDLSKVVDSKKDKPKYAGHNDLTPQFGASLLKIVVMSAAYQLQYDLNVMARKNPTWDSKKLFDEARAAWADTQVPVKGTAAEPVRPGDPAKFKRKNKLIEIGGSNVPLVFDSWWADYRPNKFHGAPNLENIFASDTTPIGDRGVSFSKKTAGFSQSAVDAYLSTKHHPQDLIDANLPFSERLYLMADVSDNSAARSCALDVGFLYIHSAAWQADLFNPQRGGGPTLTLPYGTPQWKEGGVLGGAQHSTTVAMAALMTHIVTDGFVSPTACDQMKWLLDKQKDSSNKTGNWMNIEDQGGGSRTYSPVQFSLNMGFSGNAFKWKGATITPTQVNPDRVLSKLGLLPEDEKNSLESDCAYVQRKVGSRTLKYVISFLNWEIDRKNVAGPRGIVRQRLIAGLDKCVQENT